MKHITREDELDLMKKMAEKGREMRLKTMNLPTFKIPKNYQYDYCPICRKRTPHIKELGAKLCKRCGHQDKY